MKLLLIIGFLTAQLAFAQVNSDDRSPYTGPEIGGDSAPQTGAASRPSDASLLSSAPSQMPPSSGSSGTAGGDKDGDIGTAASTDDASAGAKAGASASAKADAFASGKGGSSASASASASGSAFARAQADAVASSNSTSEAFSKIKIDKYGSMRSYIKDYVKTAMKCTRCERHIKNVSDRVRTYMRICGPSCPKNKIEDFVRLAVQKEKQYCKPKQDDMVGAAEQEGGEDKYVALLPVVGMSEIRKLKPVKKLVAVDIKPSSKSRECGSSGAAGGSEQLREFKSQVNYAIFKYLRENPSQLNNQAELTHYVREVANKYVKDCEPCKEWMEKRFTEHVKRKMTRYQKRKQETRINKYVRHFQAMDRSKIESIEIQSGDDMKRYARRTIQWCLSHKTGPLNELRHKCRQFAFRQCVKKLNGSRIQVSKETLRGYVRLEFQKQFRKFKYYEESAREQRSTEDKGAFSQMKRLDLPSIQKFEIKSEEDFRSYVRQLIQYRLSHARSTFEGKKMEEVSTDIKKFVQEKFSERSSTAVSFKVGDSQLDSSFTREFSQEYSHFESMQKSSSSSGSGSEKSRDISASASPAASASADVPRSAPKSSIP